MWLQLALVSVWLTGLMVATLAVKREAVFVSVSASSLDRVTAGPALGARLPRELGPPGERRIVLFLDSDCPPCHEFARQLHEIGRPSHLTVAISGPAQAQTASDMADAIPQDATLLVGSRAEAAVEAARITFQPFALAVADGIVVGKSYPTSAESLERLFKEEVSTT